MKKQSLMTALAFLIGAFVWGCQESGPVAPESLGPQFHEAHADCTGHKKNNPGCGGNGDGDATFTATITGDVESVENILLRESAVGLSTVPGDAASGTPPEPAMLNLTYFKEEDGADLLTGFPSTCFDAGTFTGPFQILVKKNDLPNVRSSFWFPAKGFDGSPVNYEVTLFGEVKHGNFSPAMGATTKITWETFDVIHSNGPGRSVACTGTGMLTSSTETVVTGTTS